MSFLKRLAARDRPFTSCVTGIVRDCQRPGRPRATTARKERFITLTHSRQRLMPVTVIARRYGLPAQIIRNCLRKITIPFVGVALIKAR